MASEANVKTKGAFTQPKWRITGDAGHPSNIRITSTARRHIAKVYAESAERDPICEANAALIAAAPEMFEALVYARESLGDPVPVGRRHVARRLDAAIERAQSPLA